MTFLYFCACLICLAITFAIIALIANWVVKKLEQQD